MQAGKRMQSRALSQMASATKKYPRFFHPHEVQAVADIDDAWGETDPWETVDGEDPDVFLVPSGVANQNHAITARLDDLEESGIYDLGPASVRAGSAPNLAGRHSSSQATRPSNGNVNRSSALGVEPAPSFRQPSRPDYADASFLDMAPPASPRLSAPSMAMFTSLPMTATPPSPVPAAFGPLPSSYDPYAPYETPLPPASQPLSGFAPNSTSAAVFSVAGRPPPSLLATIPRQEAPVGAYTATLGAIALAAMCIFGGSHIVKGQKLAFHQAAASMQQAPAEPAVTPPPAPQASNDGPAMDLGAALGNTSLGAPTSVKQAPIAGKAAPVATPPASASATKSEPAAVRAKAALEAGDLSEASLLFAEMTDAPATRLDGAVGLAEVARARGDNRGAATRYREILVNYPAYFPARLGLADATWDSGDEAGARALYVAMQKTYAGKLLPTRVIERSAP